MVILDLEWNAAYSRKNRAYINEIIEFGAVKCGPDLEKKDSFACFVKPQVSKHVSALVSDLTSITDENLTDGVSFMQAVSRFRKWAGECLILTWGPSDILALVENCRYFSGDERVPFLQYYCDLQKYAQARLQLGSAEQLGLSAAAELLQLDLTGVEQHRARDDSLVTLEILKKLYDEKELNARVLTCDDEFYRRVTFKTSYICDLQSPLVKKEDLRVTCPRCGAEGRRTDHWALRNRGFRGSFTCPECGYRFGARLVLKLKYEGLNVSKKTFPLPVIEAPREALPGPVGQMRLELTDGVGLLRFPGLDDLQAVNAAFSTRLGGVSGGKGKEEFAAMNLGFGRGDADENVEKNYGLLCAAGGFEATSLVTGNQDHHTNIRRVTAEERGMGIWTPKTEDSVDGLCTDEDGVTLVIYCADCVPIYYIDEEHHALGLAHAGWRGTVAGMAEIMVRRMEEEFGTRPEGLRAAIGPSICKECFEVDEPVAAEFLKLPGSEAFVTGPALNGSGEEKYHVDLWECNRQFLLKAGVPEENILVGGLCTMCESDLVFSHRKTGGRRGSNAALLGWK